MSDDLREGNQDLHDKINQIAEMVREMHQRQNERTIPAIEKVEKAVFGNGKKGLLEEHLICKTNVNNEIEILKRFMFATLSLSASSLICIIGFFAVKIINLILK